MKNWGKLRRSILTSDAPYPSQPIIPRYEHGEDNPYDDQERSSSTQEIHEPVIAWTEHEQVGLVADRRGEGAAGGEDDGMDERHGVRPRFGRGADGDRREEQRRRVVR